MAKARLELFKEHGRVSMTRVLGLGPYERLPFLAKMPGMREDLITAIAASLKSAFSNLNLKFSMSESQVVELADMIIDQSSEDDLGLEDVLLFLEEMLTGKCGKIYDRMDIPLFFDLFEHYRQRRHEAVKAIRDEEDAQFRALPVNDRFVYDSQEDEKNKSRRAMADFIKTQNEQK